MPAARPRRSTPRARRSTARSSRGSSALVEALEAEIREAPAPVPPDPDANGEPLSPEELSVLELLPSGLTYREIAERLALPLDTVRAHGRRIRRKLGAVTRGEAVTAARRLELL